ncbi:MAG: FadR/GntR family transcriptional regulator [Ectobacillus sp.]
MSLTFDRKGISEQVADYIKKMIREGKYAVGEKIPGERDMALTLQVSRNTVREAYKILEAYGYLVARHGTGVFVASEDEQIRKMAEAFFVTTDQIKDLFAVRKILETNSMEWVIQHASAEQIEELVEIVARAKELSEEADSSEQLSELDHRFHLLLATMSENSVLIRIMHNLIDLLAQARTQSIQIPGRAAQSIEEHENIVAAIQARDAALAKQYMSEHLESVERSIMRNLEEKG